MSNRENEIKEIISYCKKKPGVYESRPFGSYPICYRIMGKIFAQLNPQPEFYRITLKCNPEKAYDYRQIYPGVVVRGYHCPPVQQPYWNTIDLDVFSDVNMLYQMIDEAYDEVIAKLTKREKLQFIELAKLEFKDTDGEDADFVMLCEHLDEALNEQVGGETQQSQYNQYNMRDQIHHVIVVYLNGQPVGCGGFKMYDEEHAELKRIYTAPICRGIGLGTEIVRRLEAKAKILGYQWCILETGVSCKAACHIYQKHGYIVIPNYGPYVDMELSVCMQRKI